MKSAILVAMINAVSANHGVPPQLTHSIVRIESSYNCNAYNHGSVGIMQVKPATARSVGVYGNLRDCRNGVEAGVRYLRLALNAAHGNWAHAATLYNRGVYARPANSAYARKALGR